MDVQQLEAKLQETQEVDAKLDLIEEIAGHYYDQDDYQTALGFYQQGENLATSSNSRAYYVGQKGVCHYLLQQDKPAEEALLAFKRLVRQGGAEVNPELHGLVLYFLGSLYEYRGDVEASLRERQAALKHLKHLPREAQWMLLAGMSRNHADRGDHRRAVEFSARALSLISDGNPELAYLYESMGASYFELGEYEEALRYFCQVLEVDPEFDRKDEIYLQIGRCCRMRLDFQMALSSYLKILELKQLTPPDGGSLAWLYIEIVTCLYHLKDFRKALEYVAAALAGPVEDPEELAELRSHLTNCLHGLGEHRRAVEEGERTLRERSRFKGLELMLPNLALSYYKLNDKENFLRCRERCNQEFPDLSWTRQLNKLAV